MNKENALALTWNLEPVTVTARLIPRYAFMSASINVEIGGHLVLATGGVFKVTGSCAGVYERHGQMHEVEIAWGLAKLRSFPVKLTIDGELLMRSNVKVSNWWMMYWPFIAILGLEIFTHYALPLL